MGKHGKVSRHYKKVWEVLPWAKGWLQEIEVDNQYKGNDAYCKVCKTSLRAHQSDLEKHSTSKKHKENMARMNPNPRVQRTLENVGIGGVLTTKQKTVDLQLAVFVAVHSSIKTMDHLSELLSTLGKGSPLENLKLHRTKCSALIKTVISPCMLDDLVKDVGDGAYSLIIDESTDVSVMKFMCICIRFFSKKENSMLTDFLGIVEVIRATAVDLTDSICEYLLKVNLKLSNLSGIGTDGASNMCGSNHSVFTLLKEKVPTLQLVKCVCHSLHLCASKATEELPSSVDFMAREVFNWFSCSPLRKAAYKEVFDTLNIGDGNKFRNLVQLSKTRWLSRAQVVSRLIEQWLELKTHFKIVALQEKCYTARLISEMLQDETNYLYLIFLKPILTDLNDTNMIFQSSEVEVSKTFEQLRLLFLSVARRVLKPSFLDHRTNSGMVSLDQVSQALDNPLAFLPISEADFGHEFGEHVRRVKQGNIVSNENVNTVKVRCFNFLVKLCKELAQRLPQHIEVLEKTQMFLPEKCLSQFRPRFDKLPIEMLDLTKVNLVDIENQWRKLLEVNWSIVFNGTVEKSTGKFWPVVYQYTDAGGRKVFKELSEFALLVLSLPISNAVVERVFSVMNSTKTKVRNRMLMPLLDSLIRIKVHLNVRNICCKEFVPSKEMIIQFNSNVMYPIPSKESDEDGENVDETEQEYYDIVNECYNN